MKLTRQIEIDGYKVDEQLLTLTIATEKPYKRVINGTEYNQILPCTDQAINGQRFSDGKMPLLLEHNPEKQIGVMQRVWPQDGKLYVQVRFATGSYAQQVKNDIITGIRRNTSVGYIIQDYVIQPVNGDIPNFIAKRWMPYQGSIVAIPADSDCGYNRALEEQQIRALADMAGVSDKADQAIKNGLTAEDFKQQIKTINNDNDKTNKDIKKMDKENKAFSLSRAILNNCPQYKGEKSQFQMQISEDNKRAFSCPDADICVKFSDLMANRALTGTALIGNAYMPQFFGGTLFNTPLSEAGYTHLTAQGKTGSISIATTVSGTNCGMVSDVDGQLAQTDAKFALRELKPHKGGAYVQIPYSLLTQASPSIQQIIRADLLGSISNLREQQIIKGDGSDGEITGLINMSDVNTYPLTGFFSLSGTLKAEAKIRNDGDFNPIVYVMSANNAIRLQTTPKSANNQHFIMENGLINGNRVIITPHIGDDAIILADWKQVFVADFDALQIQVDSISGLRSGCIYLYIWTNFDATVRRKKSVCIIK